MNCSHVRMPGGGVALVCGQQPRVRPCRHCACEHRFLCDWKFEAIGTVHTCDRPLCSAHAHQVGPDRHLCPQHAAEYVLWLQHEGIAY